jgi:hypothetical protein
MVLRCVDEVEDAREDNILTPEYAPSIISIDYVNDTIYPPSKRLLKTSLKFKKAPKIRPLQSRASRVNKPRTSNRPQLLSFEDKQAYICSLSLPRYTNDGDERD